MTWHCKVAMEKTALVLICSFCTQNILSTRYTQLLMIKIKRRKKKQQQATSCKMSMSKRKSNRININSRNRAKWKRELREEKKDTSLRNVMNTNVMIFSMLAPLKQLQTLWRQFATSIKQNKTLNHICTKAKHTKITHIHTDSLEWT